MSENTLRSVLVGCGGMSRLWIKAIRETPGLELVGLVDIKDGLAEERAREFDLGSAATGTDLKTVLDDAKPEIVFDITIPESHAAVTLEALQRGCHVLGEKPLADSMQNARKMVEAAQRAGKLYAITQSRRYHEGLRRTRAFVESGLFGKLTTLNSDFFLAPHFGGFRDAMQHVLLLDMAIHTFDAARYLVGADPVSVYCKEWNPSGSWYAHGASAVAIFEFSNGVIYTYRGSWCAEGVTTGWNCDWRLTGERGSALWNGELEFKGEIVKETTGFMSDLKPVEFPPLVDPKKAGGHQAIIAEFVDCVRNGKTPETTCVDNIKSLAMVFGAIESADTGRRVEITV